jgi:hypothetical protein
MSKNFLKLLAGLCLVAVFTLALSPAAQLKRVADFYFDVAVGEVRSHSSVIQSGQNSDVDNATQEDIWDGGGTWNEPSASQVYTITSTSANDKSDGTGARTLELFGLDSAGALQSETVSLTGTVVVTAANSYSMIHEMIVRTAGSGGVNAGTITANANTDGNITAQINVGNNKTMMAIYKIPAGSDGCVTNFSAAINRVTVTGSVDIFLYAKPTGEVWQLENQAGLVAAGVSRFQHVYKSPLCFEPLTLVKMAATTPDNNTGISAGFDLIAHPN